MIVAVVVENADASEAIVLTLRTLGLTVHVCSSVDELTTFVPDIAFCEWPLRASATPLIEYLQGNATSPTPTRIVVLVPGGSLALHQRARQLGACDVLFSPP